MKNKYTHQCAVPIILCLLITFNSSPIFSQDQPRDVAFLVTGKVQDNQGPLAGVNVILKNKGQGTITNFEGAFALVATSMDTLVFTYIGYEPQEISINNKTDFEILMSISTTTLDQITINAGYYSVTEKEKTGSISRISASEIEKQIVSNPLAALQGRIPGVKVSEISGLAGSGIDIQIRGKSSITAGNAPLYVIDGIPFNSQTLSASSVSGSIIPFANLSPFSFLNPSDIESIEVLKDADATSIYGSRGANGVVLITTKKGEIQKPKFMVSVKSGVGKIAHFQRLLNTEQYLSMRRTGFANDGITEIPSNAYDVNGTWDTNRYTDWQKELIGKTAYLNEYGILFSGGEKTTSYLLSGNIHKESTIFPGDYAYIRGNGLGKVDYVSHNDKMKLSFTMGFSSEKNDLPGSDLSYQALTLPPNAPKLFKEDGELNWEEGTFNNPLAALNSSYKTLKNSLLINGEIAYEFSRNLEFKSNFGFNDIRLSEYRTFPHTIFPPYYGLTSSSSALYSNEGMQSSWIIEPQLNYSYGNDVNKFETLIGYSAQQEDSKTLTQFAEGFADNSQILNLAAANYIKVESDIEVIYKYRAIFGRFNYAHAKKYLINLTGRRDGSSRFGPNKRFSNFGAIGAAWIFSEEKGVKSIFPFLNYGKLRGSYGVTGNDQIGDYRYLNSYSSTGIGYNGTIGLSPTGLYNPNFRWEKNRKVEIALEFEIWDNIKSVINYYRNRSSNQLVEVPLPGTTGSLSILANLDALVENRGWEFEWFSKNVQSEKWQWNTSFNFTLPKNELLKFPNLSESTYSNNYVIGQPITIRKVLHAIGVDPQTGMYLFEDFNGDGKISIPDDSHKIVDLAPKFYGGLTNSIKYRDFEMDIFFEFSKQTAPNLKSWGSPPGVMMNQPIDVLDAWVQPGDQTSTQAFTSGANYERSIAAYNLSQSDAAYSDASFLRLRNFSLTYNLKNILGETSSAKIFLQGQNIYTWTNFKGQDPEQLQGFIPALRRVNLGLSVIF